MVRTKEYEERQTDERVEQKYSEARNKETECLSFLCTAFVLFLCSQKAYISFQETDSIR